jgi:hypothetical protein
VEKRVNKQKGLSKLKYLAILLMEDILPTKRSDGSHSQKDNGTFRDLLM